MWLQCTAHKLACSGTEERVQRGGAHLKMGRGVIGPKQCTERKQRKLSTSGVMGAVSGLEGGFFISQLVHSLLFVFVSIYITFEF